MTTITLRLSIDADRNGNIDPAKERVGLAQAACLDKNGDGKLTGRELDSLYFAWNDTWLQGNRTHTVFSHGHRFTVRLDKVDFKNNAISVQLRNFGR